MNLTLAISPAANAPEVTQPVGVIPPEGSLFMTRTKGSFDVQIHLSNE